VGVCAGAASGKTGSHFHGFGFFALAECAEVDGLTRDVLPAWGVISSMKSGALLEPSKTT